MEWINKHGDRGEFRKFPLHIFLRKKRSARAPDFVHGVIPCPDTETKENSRFDCS
ncbi:Uncharacterized protein APZ42_004711 [Daphnia magna]|uniref:Uncharacterized protein n=1 Tax=Daphnia magna TaxID=35525 RepID=A0A162BZW3_9CRUS|nr:Uncharacterized protein APZ42_004711 [Daphnia magna]